MANKDQLRQIANMCSQYRFMGNNLMTSEAKILGDTIKSCENCKHFTAEHKCDINLVDEILSNMDIKLDEGDGDGETYLE